MAPRNGNDLNAPGSRRASRLPRVVWAAAWVSFFADFSTELIYGVLPAFYLQTLSLSIVSLGVIEGLAEAVVAFTKLWSGSLSDRTGRRPVWMLAGYSLSGLAKPLIGLASGGLLVGSLRALDRLGKGIRGAPRDALITDAVCPTDRGRAFGVLRALDHAGALVGGLVAAGLLASGLVMSRQLFFLSAIPGAVVVLIIVLFIRETGTPARDRPATTPYSVLDSWRRATPGLKRFLVPVSIFALGNSSDMLLLAIAYERFIEIGYAQSVALGLLPLLWALLHMIRSLGSIWAGAQSDRTDRVTLVRLGWLVYSAVYLIAAWLAFGGPVWLAWVVFALYGLHTILTEAPEKALVADLAPDANTRGGAFGLVQFVSGVGILPATVLAATLWMTLGAGVAFVADAVLAAIAAIMLGWFNQTHMRPLQDADGGNDPSIHTAPARGSALAASLQSDRRRA